MNKKEAVEAYLNLIELNFSHRIVEQTVKNGRFENADTCEWNIECIHHLPREKWDTWLFHQLDTLTTKTLWQLYGGNYEHSTLGEWWAFEDKTMLTIPKAVERIRRGYKKTLESLQWCKKHQSFSIDRYCVLCEDEEFEREQALKQPIIQERVDELRRLDR